MIPYMDMTFADWTFYWGESVLFTKIAGEWRGVCPMSRDDNGDYLHRDSDRLDDIDSIQFGYHSTGTTFSVPALEPFTSDDWVTYEPALGYFIIGGKLALITSEAPRNRIKGLHPRRLRSVVPLDTSALPKSVAGAISLETSMYDYYNTIVKEIASRMNNPFTMAWYHKIDKAIQEGVSPAVILHSDVAFVPVKGTDYGHLLFKGTLLGRVIKVGTKMRFVPRCKPITSIETVVNSWVLSKLTR